MRGFIFGFPAQKYRPTTFYIIRTPYGLSSKRIPSVKRKYVSESRHAAVISSRRWLLSLFFCRRRKTRKKALKDPNIKPALSSAIGRSASSAVSLSIIETKKEFHRWNQTRMFSVLVGDRDLINGCAFRSSLKVWVFHYIILNHITQFRFEISLK